MANLLWNENSPADTDSAGAGDDEIRSLKTSIRNGLAAEHVWPSATGSGFGVHALGSARAFYDVESNVSSSGTDGRLLVTSDSSRLFHVGSAGTMFLGGQTTISAGSSPVGGQRFYWAQEWGEVFVTTANFTVAFNNSGFSGVPSIVISGSTANASAVYPFPVVTAKTATQFSVRAIDASSGVGVPISNYTLTYISLGTRTL